MVDPIIPAVSATARAPDKLTAKDCAAANADRERLIKCYLFGERAIRLTTQDYGNSVAYSAISTGGAVGPASGRSSISNMHAKETLSSATAAPNT